jgi:Protein of unknown function DUF262
MDKLQFSIPANNSKIIELYNKFKKNELESNPAYQRKLVWRKQHKLKFIETILLNYPFPEIYLAPGILDTEELSLTDQIVDGQQRLTTIINYVDSKDVFSLQGISIKKFSELSKEEKEQFLNYEISVRYLKNATQDQVREIFQRINSTEYSLNTTERLNAQWGDSEFICFGKQIIETDLDIDSSLINYKINPTNREHFIIFFHTKYNVFTENDINRMLALQYILTLLTTLCEGEYFRRNDKVQLYIESYFDEFEKAAEIEVNLLSTIQFIDSLVLDSKSYWFNKANIFTLIVECFKYDLDSIDKEIFKKKLLELERVYKINNISQFDRYIEDENASNTNAIQELGEIIFEAISTDDIKYFDSAREAVNDLGSREYRGKFLRKYLSESVYYENTAD